MDLEHYLRVAQQILDEHADDTLRPRPWHAGDDDHDTETELVSRFMQDADNLGRSLGDLIIWLQNQRGRKAVLSYRDRGNQRIPKE